MPLDNRDLVQMAISCYKEGNNKFVNEFLRIYPELSGDYYRQLQVE